MPPLKGSAFDGLGKKAQRTTGFRARLSTSGTWNKPCLFAQTMCGRHVHICAVHFLLVQMVHLHDRRSLQGNLGTPIAQQHSSRLDLQGRGALAPTYTPQTPPVPDSRASHSQCSEAPVGRLYRLINSTPCMLMNALKRTSQPSPRSECNLHFLISTKGLRSSYQALPKISSSSINPGWGIRHA